MWALLFGLVVVVVGTPLHSPFLGGVRIDALHEEALIQGGYVGGKHAIFATEDLSIGRVLAHVDASLLWRADAQGDTTQVQQLMWRLLSDEGRWLVHEMEGLSSPLLWNRDDVLLLRETQLWSSLRSTLSALKEKYEAEVKPKIGRGELDVSYYSFTRWKQAYSIVRALQMSDVDGNSTLLVPWIALFSYAGQPNAHMRQNNDSSIDIVVSSPVKSGQIVVLNDDIPGAVPSDNFRLFDLYGVLLSKRRFTYAVRVALDRKDPMFGNKRELFDRYFKGSKSFSHEFLLDGSDIPRDLVFALRVYNADLEDFHDMRNALDGKPISARAERSTWETLGAMCKQKLANFPTTIDEDKQLLLHRRQLSRNAKNAILWRRAEKRILNQTLHMAEREAKAVHDRWLVRDTDPLRMKSENHFETEL